MSNTSRIKVLYPSIHKSIRLTFQNDATIIELINIVDEIVSSLTINVDALISTTDQINYKGKFINVFINLNFDVGNDFEYNYQKAMYIVKEILDKYQM